MQNPQREVQPTMTFNIYLSYDKVTVSTTTPLCHTLINMILNLKVSLGKILPLESLYGVNAAGSYADLRVS